MLPNRSPSEFQYHMDQVSAPLEVDDDLLLDFEGLEDISNDEMVHLCFLLNTEEDADPSQSDPSKKEWSLDIDASMDIITLQQPMILSSESMQADSQVIHLHLLMAYCEAVEKELVVLADAIGKRLIEKANPTGNLSERLLYYLFQTHDHKQFDYLKQESMKNFRVCSRAFYQILPYGMFAHFASNSIILNSIRQDADIIQVFDFDIGNGVQWSSLVTASELQQKELRITSIRWRNNEESWREDRFSFEETKNLLYDHARAFNLKLTMDEIELCNMIKKTKEKCIEKRVVCAFNCMVSLPHMMKGRSKKDVMEFMRVAEQFACDGHKVVITFGDGDACGTYENQVGFCSFFEENMAHYQAYLESMDHNFSKDLKAAKTAMECLFVAPFVSLTAWMQKWEVQKELQWEPVFEGWEVSEEIIFESKLMVIGDGMHQVKVEGDSNNQIVLLWKEQPLVRVSFWKN